MCAVGTCQPRLLPRDCTFPGEPRGGARWSRAERAGRSDFLWLELSSKPGRNAPVHSPVQVHVSSLPLTGRVHEQGLCDLYPRRETAPHPFTLERPEPLPLRTSVPVRHSGAGAGTGGEVLAHRRPGFCPVHSPSVELRTGCVGTLSVQRAVVASCV